MWALGEQKAVSIINFDGPLLWGHCLQHWSQISHSHCVIDWLSSVGPNVCPNVATYRDQSAEELSNYLMNEKSERSHNYIHSFSDLINFHKSHSNCESSAETDRKGEHYFSPNELN